MNNQLSIFLDSLKTDLINSMQAKGVGSGSAANNITVTTNGDQAQLQIPGYLQIAESGRGPTSKNAPKSNPPMIQRIQQWCREKGIHDREAWAVKKAIDKHGFKGKPGLLTEPLSDENIELRLKAVMDKIADELMNSLTEMIK